MSKYIGYLDTEPPGGYYGDGVTSYCEEVNHEDIILDDDGKCPVCEDSELVACNGCVFNTLRYDKDYKTYHRCIHTENYSDNHRNIPECGYCEHGFTEPSKWNTLDVFALLEKAGVV